MKKQYSTAAGLLVLAVLVSCASKLAPVKISNSSNPSEEVSNQGQLLDQARKAQVDVLAPDSFSKAKDYLSDAQKLSKTGKSSEEVFQTLGLSKAYLNQAETDAKKSQGSVSEITDAREKALAAGAAKNFSDELNVIDRKLIDFTEESKIEISAENRTALQNSYLKLELLCIKDKFLGNVKKDLKNAENRGAVKITPKAYDQALQKFHIADKLIETDRHSDVEIMTAVTEAETSSKRVLSLLETEQISRSQTPEQRAMAIESRDLAVKDSNALTSAVVADSQVKDQILVAQGARLNNSRDENNELKRKEHDEKVVTDAAAKFSNSEADVYRQDGVLIIRLKSMNFSSGRSDLPSDSISVLTKVKDVMKNLGAGAVTVQGHTDDVGGTKVNQKLSENRAESVMKFFESDTALSNNKMDYVGYGYSKPLGSNKTKEGRAQNRRVDILISTPQAL